MGLARSGSYQQGLKKISVEKYKTRVALRPVYRRAKSVIECGTKLDIAGQLNIQGSWKKYAFLWRKLIQVFPSDQCIEGPPRLQLNMNQSSIAGGYVNGKRRYLQQWLATKKSYAKR